MFRPEDPRVGLLAFACHGARWLGLCVLLAGPLAAQTPDAGPKITAIQQFWDLAPEQKARPQEFEIAGTITYFDPNWRILFFQDTEGSAAYVPYGDNPHAFKFGEAVLARGTFVPPSLDISFEHATLLPRTGTLPAPLVATNSVSDHAHFINRYVALNGFVDRERRMDETHLQLTLSVNGEIVFGWILMDPKAPTPDLADRKVQLKGVYNPKIGPDGLLSSLEIMVGSLDAVTVLGKLDEDPGFTLPVSPINSLTHTPASQLVHIVGTVVSREPGRSVRIRDNGGQVELMTGQMRPLAINDTVEAIGYPSVSGLQWRLENALFRSYARPAAPVAVDAVRSIGLAADVLKLSAEEAAQGRPVQLTGVVTWSNSKSPFFFIHDSSGGICVLRGTAKSGVRSPGRNLELRGVTGMGEFAPVVIASSFDRVSEAILPVARPISVEHALSGVEEAQWVEMRGYLRHIRHDDKWNYLELATATSDFTAVLPLTEDVSAMIGSVIRLQGVCAAEADARRKLTGVRLYVPGGSYVQVEEPAPADPFSVPARSLVTLGQFETVQSFNRRVRVSGVVLRQLLGHSISIAEKDHSLLVQTRGTLAVQPGDRLEAVGFLGREGGRLTLREAVYRVTGHEASPAPVHFEPQDAPDPALDGQLVTIDGTLLTGAVAGRFVQLTVQAPRKIFEASFELGRDDFKLPAPGSRLALTGVYSVGYDERNFADLFALRLRSPADIVVLEAPSWWTRRRIQAFTGVLALGALAFVGWISLLRRQVRRQTGLIREQVDREARMQAELARAGKLESLGLLAGGIAHDFNNLLTVLLGNISLARLDHQLSEESSRSLAQAEKAAGRARDLTHQLLTFAKGGAPIRSAVSLPEVVKEVAEFAVHGSQVRCEFDLPANLWPASVDKGQIGQVVQNIVINALQAMPSGGVVKIALGNHEVGAEFAGVLAPGRYVRLDFTDQGTGIPAADLGRIFDPYFSTKKQGSGLGLATVHSIVKKHAGHVSAESAAGRGTTFHVWLPAAESAAQAAAAVPILARPNSAGVAGARVLLMDDEEFIRNLGCSILKRFGYDATAVAEGTDAIAEYARAHQAGRPYQLVILDLTIPGGIGGRQTMEELLKLDPRVKAIVSSGYSNDQVLANYRAHGFHGMISKPYNAADFAHAVERVLKGERA